MDWNYDELAEKLAMGRIDVDEAVIPLVLEEARKRHDGNVIAHVASRYEDVKDNKPLYLELAKEAAELGSPEANFWLGHEYLSGENLPRDYEKAYSCFINGKDVDWVPIDPEGEVDVTSEGLLLYGDIGWWLFLLEKHPTRAVKCGLADWYMKHDGDENHKRALQLLEESANEGFEFAFSKLIEFYSEGEFKDVAKGRHWFEKAVEHGFDMAVFADALGVESLLCRKLKVVADSGDCVAAAKLACAYLRGGYDGGDNDFVCCAKDEIKARHYGQLACAEEEGLDMLIGLLDIFNSKDQAFLAEVSG